LEALRPHQKDALSKLKSGSILWGGVGSGKSKVAAAFYMKMWADANVIVITTARKRDSLDWQEEFAKFGVGTDPRGTVAGVLTVDSWNNIHKYEDITDAFFIFDEQRLVGRGGWVRSFLQIAKRNHWVLLTATPGDSWLDYIPVFLAHGFYKNRTEFKAQHVIYKSYTKFPAVDRYVNTGRLIKYRSEILVEMPYERHTKRHYVAIPVNHNKALLKTIMQKKWNPYTDQPIQHAAELYSLMRMCVNSDPSRLEALKKKMEKHPRLIVFYNFDYELELLRGISGRPVAEWNGHKHEEIPETDSWVYLVQFTAGAEAWNCIETNATFFYSQNPSYKKTEQAFGRIDRLNTPFIDLYYYIPLSNTWIDGRLRQAFVEKRDFNMSELTEL
jgi:hypothetical protein